ncbi:conserved Plasmodium protein, unknown function [Plasmodium chabaudi chabaudi]|uniref:Uncharacterized protein n=1 Tax=Plasmodium chabaudi chabaudi TaxID=31271 RepID=A0A4V0K2M0_PLACU|nr:conserved Plasmodium protein, unknown function [Plasmodium chabaudi chabaudi]VTZ66524.1 conserved Plasmodium protein, unknown function [Plasmodium chabaudi chabaudi]|eukprot:XP_745937.2 conserved Plasmodium protein, unknown function [Plasmodium chabaudi chabaudi]
MDNGKNKFNERLLNEFENLKGYDTIRDVLSHRLKNKQPNKYKEGKINTNKYLQKLIESKYVNKIFCELFLNKKCAKKFANNSNIFSPYSVKKIIQIKKEKNEKVEIDLKNESEKPNDPVILHHDIKTETTYFYTSEGNNFYIFFKINHYINKELFYTNTNKYIPSIFIFLYDINNFNKIEDNTVPIQIYNNGKNVSSMNYQLLVTKCYETYNHYKKEINDFLKNSSNILKKNIKKKRGTPINNTNVEEEKQKNQNYIKKNITDEQPNKICTDRLFIKEDKKNKKKNTHTQSQPITKKIVDQYVLLTNHEDHNEISYFDFINIFENTFYKYSIIDCNFEHNLEKLNWLDKKWNDKSYDEKIDIYFNFKEKHKSDKTNKLSDTNIFCDDLKNDKTQLHKYQRDVSIPNERNTIIGNDHDIKSGVHILMKENKIFNWWHKSYFIFSLTKNNNNFNQICAIKNFKRVIHLLKKNKNEIINNPIYVYSSRSKGGNEFYITYNNVNKCFSIFMPPFLIYFNKDKWALFNLNEYNSQDQRKENPRLLLNILVELFLSIRMIYLKKKIIRKLKAYLLERTLKGYARCKMNSVKNKSSNCRKASSKLNEKNNITYEYTFYSVIDNLFLAQGDNYIGNNRLFKKIKKVLLKCTNFNKYAFFKFSKTKVEHICACTHDLMSWANKFEHEIFKSGTKEHVYIHFVQKKTNIFPNCINEGCDKSNAIIKRENTFYKICSFKITSYKDKILQISKNICMHLFHLFKSLEKSLNWDTIYILKHAQFILLRFPYICYAICCGKRNAQNLKRVLRRTYIHYRSMCFCKKYLKRTHKNILHLIKKKKKKVLWNTFLNKKDIFLFWYLLKIQKLLLYFYLCMITNYCAKKSLRCCCYCSVKQKKDIFPIRENDPKQVSYTYNILHKTFIDLIKEIKSEKQKKKIFLHFRKNANISCLCKVKSSTFYEQSEKSSYFDCCKKTKKKKIAFTLKSVHMNEYFLKNKKNVQVIQNGNNNQKEEIVKDANQIQNSVLQCEYSIEEKTCLKQESYCNFFKLKNMKRLIINYGNCLTTKTNEEFNRSKKKKKRIFLNANKVKHELVKIAHLFQCEAKDVINFINMIYKGTSQTTVEIYTEKNTNDDKNKERKKMKDDLQEVSQTITLLLSKEMQVNKNLAVYNILPIILKEKKSYINKNEKINYKIIREFFYSSEYSLNKISNNSNIHKYHIKLNYLAFFINGHMTYSVDIFCNNYEKLNISKDKIYFLNINKNYLIKNLFIETTLYFIEYVFSQIAEIATFVKSNKYNKTKRNRNIFNIYKILCYEMNENEYKLKKKIKIKKSGKYVLKIFIFPKKNILFLYSYENKINENIGRICNPIVVKFFKQDIYYETFLESSYIRSIR